MCGVVGVCLRPDAYGPDAHDVTFNLLTRLASRGPDGIGVVTSAQTALGMTRLRVRSSPEDRIPFTDVASRTAYAFNGEVYQAGGVVPAGGLDEARCLFGPWPVDGMYAVISNPPDGTMTLTRDPLGIKPLYLRESADGVAVASEMAPLLHAFDRPPLRVEAFAQFLLTGRRVVDGGSFFDGIRPVAPGERVTVQAGQVTASHRPTPGRQRGAAPAPEILRASLEIAVDRMLLSERPIGLAVSGGLDSTILAGLLAQRGVSDLRTVSVCPEGTPDGVRALDELGLPDRDIVTWRHSHVPFGPADLLAGLPSAVRTFGEPFGMSSIPMYAALAKLAATSGIIVLLVGEGADELFGGYNRYVPLHAGAISNPLEFYLPQERRELVTRLLGPDVTDAATDALRAALRRAEENVAGPNPTPVDVVRTFELEHSLEPLLRRTDHLLMAEGIEGRTPFLHAGLPELAARLPASALVRGTRTKGVLRDAFADLLPPRYRDQTKRPFRAPVEQWLSGPLLPRVDAVLAEATESLYQRLGVLPAGMTALRKRMAFGDPTAFSIGFSLLTTVEWLAWLDEPRVRNRPGAGSGVPGGEH